MKTENRIWTKWSDKRTPEDGNIYRFRVATKVLGMDMVVEWSEEQRSCGMGYGEPRYWPLTPCHWDGYRRYMINNNIEWSFLQEGDSKDSKDVIFHGLNLIPCPFTGKQPKVRWFGRYCSSPPFILEWIGVQSHIIDFTRRDANELQKLWNQRA